MKNVVDIFSKKKLDDLAKDETVSNETIKSFGEYCGVMPEQQHKEITKMQKVLAAKHHIIRKMMKEYDDLQEEYQEVFGHGLGILGISEEDIMNANGLGDTYAISYNGHVWRIKSSDIDAFIKLDFMERSKEQETKQ